MAVVGLARRMSLLIEGSLDLHFKSKEQRESETLSRPIARWFEQEKNKWQDDQISGQQTARFSELGRPLCMVSGRKRSPPLLLIYMGGSWRG